MVVKHSEMGSAEVFKSSFCIWFGGGGWEGSCLGKRLLFLFNNLFGNKMFFSSPLEDLARN